MSKSTSDAWRDVSTVDFENESRKVPISPYDLAGALGLAIPGVALICLAIRQAAKEIARIRGQPAIVQF